MRSVLLRLRRARRLRAIETAKQARGSSRALRFDALDHGRAPQVPTGRAGCADSGKGDIWQRPAAKGPKADSIRIMDPEPDYPEWLRALLQLPGPADRLERGSRPVTTFTHIPIRADGTYPTPKGWKP